MTISISKYFVVNIDNVTPKPFIVFHCLKENNKLEIL